MLEYSVDDSLDSADLMLDSLNKLADMLEMHSLFENEYLRLFANIVMMS